MESKKNPSKDIHKRYPLHFFAGLCISCGLVIGAFEMKFRKEADVVRIPYDFDDALAYVDPNFLIDRPAVEVKKQATPLKVVRTQVPATIAIATEPELEAVVMRQEDPFEPTAAPVSAPALPDVPDDEVVFAPEEMPEPVNGFEAFYKQLARDLRYPGKAVAAEVQGKVFVEFVVDRDGNPTLVKVIRGIGYGCDEAAVKALMKSRWTPGRQQGRPVRVKMVMPVQFSLLR
jgi:protein TonB